MYWMILSVTMMTSVTESWSLATLLSPPSGVSSTRKGRLSTLACRQTGVSPELGLATLDSDSDR